jgi:hypothetical protein
MVFPVEIRIDDEEALTERLATVREWLRNCRHLPFVVFFSHRLSCYGQIFPPRPRR